MIYTDFSKAFDTVDHARLIQKLNHYGIQNKTLDWIKSYLEGRTQQVKFRGVLSQPFLVTSGVPQGRHLGPVLFDFFVIDLSEKLQDVFFHTIFADYTKFGRVVSSEEGAQCLQHQIDTFSQWCTENGMSLNGGKCCNITFSRKRRIIDLKYSINGLALKRVHEIRDLGVILDPKLDYNSHIDTICCKGYIDKRIGRASVQSL